MPIEFYSPVSGGAIATIIAESARVLSAHGWEVSVLSRLDGNPVHPFGRVKPLTKCGREDLNLLQRRWSHWRSRFEEWDWPYFDYYRAAVTRALGELEVSPDVVVVFNDLLSPVFLRELCPKAQINVWLQNEQRTSAQNLRPSIAATSRWLTCSEYIRTWTLGQHGLPEDRVVAIPSGVNLEQFFPRSRFDAPSSPVKVLFVGRIDPNKGPDLALDAVKQLRREGLPVTITVVGATWFYNSGTQVDPYLEEIREKIADVDGVEMGHVPRLEIADVFREHDIVCVLSRSNEPFGLVVLEAMASGCAVLASNRGGLPEACGGAATLADVDDLGNVTAALRELVQSESGLATAKQQSVARANSAPWARTVELFAEANGTRAIAMALDDVSVDEHAAPLAKQVGEVSSLAKMQ